MQYLLQQPLASLHRSEQGGSREPEIASPSILQRDFGVDLEDEDPTAEEHGKADVGSAAMGERRALHDQRVAEGWHR